jgi:hypothetical protein
VRLDNGELIGADLVLVAKGIVPNVEWLRGSGVAIGRGIRWTSPAAPACRESSPPGIAPKPRPADRPLGR